MKYDTFKALRRFPHSHVIKDIDREHRWRGVEGDLYLCVGHDGDFHYIIVERSVKTYNLTVYRYIGRSKLF